jgi:putative IMPACT (imprinted ancient) family translation regulator
VSDDAVLRLLGGEGEGTITVRRSRFFGHAAPLGEGRAALAAFLEAVRARHREAGHVVYAWRGRDGATRTNDDGEPSGTGGRPLLAVLEHAAVVDSGVAVARVFGGTLLGAAGLGRAYGEAAALAVGAAPVRILRPFVTVRARASYGDQPALEAVLGAALAELGRSFAPDGVELRGELEVERVEAVSQALAEATRGRVRLRIDPSRHWR